MKNRQDWDDLVVALFYPILYEKDPVSTIQRALEVTVWAGALGASPKEYLAAVRFALDSPDKLSERFEDCFPEPPSDELLRRYLTEIERRLQDSGY